MTDMEFKNEHIRFLKKIDKSLDRIAISQEKIAESLEKIFSIDDDYKSGTSTHKLIKPQKEKEKCDVCTERTWRYPLIDLHPYIKMDNEIRFKDISEYEADHIFDEYSTYYDISLLQEDLSSESNIRYNFILLDMGPGFDIQCNVYNLIENMVNYITSTLRIIYKVIYLDKTDSSFIIAYRMTDGVLLSEVQFGILYKEIIMKLSAGEHNFLTMGMICSLLHH